MNEVLSYGVFRDAGVHRAAATFAAVSVTVPGKYDHEYLRLYSARRKSGRRFRGGVLR